MKRNDFGERLKELIKQKQLTQAQVAKAVGTSVPSVNRWTKGGEIEYDNLRSLADFLEVNWVWLRYGDEAIQSLQQTLPDNDAMIDMRREYLNQILDNEARMKSALEMAQIIHWEWNVLTGTLSLSDNASAVFGCDPKVVEAAMLPFASYQLEALSELFGSESPHSWDFSVKLNNDDTKWFSSTGKLIFDSVQRPVKVIGVTADITARKQAEQALERSEYMMRKIIDTVPVGLWAADEQGTICLANPEVKRIWGGAKYVGLDQYGEYKGWWEKTGEEVGSEGWTLARAVSEGESSSPEVVNIEAFDGEHRTIIMYATPLYDNEGKVIGAIEVNQDITEIKQTERDLKLHLQQWQAVFEQALFDVIQLNGKLKIKQLSTNLSNQYSNKKLGADKLSLGDLLDQKTAADLLGQISAQTENDVVAFMTTGKFNHSEQQQRFYVIHDNRAEDNSMTLVFGFNEQH